MSHPTLLLIAGHVVEKTRHNFKLMPTITNYLKKFIGIKYLKKKQCRVVLSSIIIPALPVSNLLQKDSELNCFSLIIAGSPPLYKGDEGWSFV